MKKGGFKRLLSYMLVFALAFAPVLSSFPAVQVKAAEPAKWQFLESGSGNGTNPSDASSAAILLHQSQKMSADGGTFSVTYKDLDTTGDTDIGFLYNYIDANNWLYVGYDRSHHWYYLYKLNGELKGNGYDAEMKSSISGLTVPKAGDYVSVSVAVSRETMVIKVDDSKKAITNQDFITLAEKADGNGRFGFRAGKNANFRFRNAKLNGELLSDEWEFITTSSGQKTEQKEVPVYDVTGTVQEKGTNTPLANATVRIGTDFVKTAADGTFAIAVEDGTYEVVISAKGYSAQVVSNVTVNGGAAALPNAVQLDKKEAVEYENWIQGGIIKAAVSRNFPQVYQYKAAINGVEKIIDGQEKDLSVVKINGVEITPVMGNVSIGSDNAVYPMTLKNSVIDMSMTVKISVSDNDLTWEVTEIVKNEGCAKINTIEFPNLNLVTITEGQDNAQFMGAVISGNVNDSGDEQKTFEDGFYANASKGYAYGFLSADGVSAGVWSNSEMNSDNRLVRNNGLNSMSLTSAAWFYDYNNENFQFSNYPTVYDGIANGVPASELPCAKVCLTGDENGDGIVDWQDGAIAYRDIMNNPYGSENTKDLVNYRISMNFSSQATNPYLKTADNIKKVYLATDGLPQAVMMKGYGSEGHDSANSEYGYVSERLGGLEELKKLNAIAHQYGVQMGIHINAQEAYPEAQTFSNDLINGPGSKGWGWLDQSYTINRAYDLGTGLRYKRLLQLYDQLCGTSLYANKWPGVAGAGEDETVADASTIAKVVAENKNKIDTNLDFMYLDVWYGDSWETRKIAQQFNSLGWRFSTEFGNEGEYDSTWQHWATEGHYGGAAMKGVNSDVIRFIRNHQKDSFVLNYPSFHGAADNPLLGGYDLSGFEGWGGSNDSFNTYITTTFLSNLPTKFLQHYKVYKWENYPEVGGKSTSPAGNHEKQITLKSDDGRDTVVVTRNEEQIENNNSDQTLNYVERTITLNGKKVLDNVKYLLPWTDSETGEEKLYFYDYHGGTSTWDLPNGWGSLGNVKVYTLTDAGRTDEKRVAVSGGKVTLTAAADTPYVVLKGNSVSPAKTVNEWSNDAHVTDTGFNGYAGTGKGDVLNPEIWSGDITDARVVRMQETGNKYLKMGSKTNKQTVSTEIRDLKPGSDYVAQVYVDNKSDAKAWIKVMGGEKSVSNYTLKSIAGNYVQCDAHSNRAVAGSNMQRMLVSFKAKTNTATLILEREPGAEPTYFDDIRIVEKKLDNMQADGSFKQDFESVVSGLYPFVLGPAQGVTDHVTHLSERHEPYTQSGWGNVVLDDVIEGDWSLKHHGSNNGIIYRTIPQNLHLEAGATYEISFDYQSGAADSYYVVVGDGENVTEMYNNPKLQKTAVGAGQKSTTEKFTFTMTASGSGQSWFGIASTGVPSSQQGSYGENDFILDNLVVKKTSRDGVYITPASATATSAKDPVEISVSFTNELDNANAVTWTSSNDAITKIVPDPEDNKKCKVYFTGYGEAVITAETIVNFETVTLSSTVVLEETYNELDDKDNKQAKFKGVWANTAAHDGDVPGNAIDGKLETQWHSSWSNPNFVVSDTNRAIITVELEDGDDVSNYNRVTIVQRRGNINGLVKKYECVIGNGYNENSYAIEEVKGRTGVIKAKKTGNGERESCLLPSGASGRYLQIQVAEGTGTNEGEAFASIAEIVLDNVEIPNRDIEAGYFTANTDKSLSDAKDALASVLEQAKAQKASGQGDYSDESWSAFEMAYEAAEEGKNGEDLAVLTMLQQNLVNAQNSLIITEEKALDKLAEAIAAADRITEQGSYTDESWNAFLAAKELAGAGGDVSLAQLVRMQQQLEKTMGNLRTPADDAKKNLSVALAAAKAYYDRKEDFTAGSWSAFEKAYEDAEEGKDGTDADALYALQTALEDAQEKLVTKLQDAKKELGVVLTETAEKIRGGQLNYGNISWGVYLTAYAAALDASESGSISDLNAAKEAVISAQKALKTSDEEYLKEVQQTFQAVFTAAASVKNLGQMNYSNASWQAFLKAYNDAEAGANSTDAYELLRLQKALEEAQRALAPDNTQSEIKNFKVGKNEYQVINAAAKTVKLTKGTNAKSANINAVSYNGVSYKVTVIGTNAFKNYQKLKSVVIGANVTSIEKNAFNNCKKLATIQFKAKKKLPAMKKKAFNKTKSKPTVKVQKALKKNAKTKKSTMNKLKKAGLKITVKNIK